MTGIYVVLSDEPSERDAAGRHIWTAATLGMRCGRPHLIPKCHWIPFLVWCISGSRVLTSFLVELGAAMMVASTMVPARFKG